MASVGKFEQKDFRSMKTSKRVAQIILWVVLMSVAMLLLIPFLWMIMTSFDFEARIAVPFPPRFWPPGGPTLKVYQLLSKNIDMTQLMINSFQVAVGQILMSVTSATLAGYGLSKTKFKGSGVVLLIALSMLMVPFEVTMISLFQLFSKMGLVGSYWAIWLPAMVYVFGTFFMKSYMDSLPDALREAAWIDGAGELTIFTRVFVPLSGPILATLTILVFLGSWNNFLWPLLIINKNTKNTLQVGVALYTQEQGTSQMPAIRMATTTLSVVPVLALYLFLQRYIVESVALTGIKQ